MKPIFCFVENTRSKCIVPDPTIHSHKGRSIAQQRFLRHNKARKEKSKISLKSSELYVSVQWVSKGRSVLQKSFWIVLS